MDVQKHIDALNKLVSGADSREAIILEEAIHCLTKGFLDQALIALNKLDLWLKQDSEWHNKVRDVYIEICTDLINEGFK